MGDRATARRPSPTGRSSKQQNHLSFCLARSHVSHAHARRGMRLGWSGKDGIPKTMHAWLGPQAYCFPRVSVRHFVGCSDCICLTTWSSGAR